VFVDESGYTGGDLLNKAQPFQTLSAICITEEKASEIINKYFPGYKGKELKYNQLKRRKTYWRPLLGLQEELLNQYNGISCVIDKKYMQLLLFLDDCWESYLYSIGKTDYYKDGIYLAVASMLYYCAPAFWGQHEFDELLYYYQVTSMKGLDLDINVNINNLVEHARSIVSKKQECSEILMPLADRNNEVIDSLFMTKQKNDISLSMLYGLIGRVEYDMSSPYIIKHDNTENMRNYRKLLDVLIGIKGDFEIYHSVHYAVKYPLKINKVEECDSAHSKGVQLADILAGSINEAANSLCGLKASNSYNQQIIKLYGERNLLLQVPRKDPEEFKKEFKNSGRIY
jgi:hypothetical protein